MRLYRNLVAALALLLGCVPAGPAETGLPATPTPPILRPDRASATFYIRPDGGSAEQCTGLMDAPYPGSGTGQPCAWDHPFRALPPGGPPRIQGGDTLVIASASYRMGLGAPGADNPDFCDTDYPWDCHMAPIPSGPDAVHPTRILGEGWDTGCASPPELWGAERARAIVNLAGSSNVEVGCLEITDHATCAEDHTGGLACGRDAYPYGDWAADGLYADDSAHVYLHDLDVHGLASSGVRAGRLTDWAVEDVRLAANGWVGWEGDIEGDDANSGTLTFRHWVVEWNGCVETYPGGEPIGCWAQTAGGYGDGVGTGETGGHWIVEDSAFLNNTSDGLDLLYVRRRPSSIVIRRTVAQGNAGNQIKVNGPALVENTVIVGNCGFFDGQSFTYDVDNCRAYGNALALNLRAGDRVTVTNDTLTGEGDCLIEVICEDGCDGSEVAQMRNNILLGQTEFGSSGNACLIYTEGFPHDPLDVDYGMIADVKGDPCPLGPHDVCDAPGLVNPSLGTFDARLLPGSPAIDAGGPDLCPSVDIDGAVRPVDGDGDGAALCDVGAYEFPGGTHQVYLPLATREPAPGLVPGVPGARSPG